MPIARTSIIRGPAIVTFGGASFYSKDDIKLAMGLDTFEIDTSIYGKTDERVKDRKVEVTFTPAGEFEALAVLWPYANTNIGASIFTGTDQPLVIKTLAGQVLTFKAAAVTKMPDIILSSIKTIIGSVTFTCIGQDDTDWTVSNSLVAVTSASFSDSSFSGVNIITQPYTVAWGSSPPWNSFQTKDGIVVSFDLSLTPLETDTDGMVDMMFSKLSVNAKCTPLGVTESDLITALKLQGSGNSRGRSMAANSNDLVVSGTGVVVTVKAAQFKMGPMDFGATTPRIGEVEFIATRTVSAGTASPLFAVATS